MDDDDFTIDQDDVIPDIDYPGMDGSD